VTFEEAAHACSALYELPDYAALICPAQVREVKARVIACAQQALTRALPWDPMMPFQKFLAIQGASYLTWAEQYLLDAVEPGPVGHEPRVDIPGTDFYYCRALLKRGDLLTTVSGNRKGVVVFDTDVSIPTLREKKHDADTVWMSTTPQEIFSLRAGLKVARGRVVVAGLGLGYQLIEASKKRSVEKVTLVERNVELFNWVWPRIRNRVRGDLTVLFGNARKIVPKLEADVAVIDIDSRYGNNSFPACPSIPRVWVWGSASI